MQRIYKNYLISFVLIGLFSLSAQANEGFVQISGPTLYRLTHGKTQPEDKVTYWQICDHRKEVPGPKRLRDEGLEKQSPSADQDQTGRRARSSGFRVAQGFAGAAMGGVGAIGCCAAVMALDPTGVFSAFVESAVLPICAGSVVAVASLFRFPQIPPFSTKSSVEPSEEWGLELNFPPMQHNATQKRYDLKLIETVTEKYLKTDGMVEFLIKVIESRGAQSNLKQIRIASPGSEEADIEFFIPYSFFSWVAVK